MGKEDEDEEDDVEGLAGKLYRKPVIGIIRKMFLWQQKFWAIEGYKGLGLLKLCQGVEVKKVKKQKVIKITSDEKLYSTIIASKDRCVGKSCIEKNK